MAEPSRLELSRASRINQPSRASQTDLCCSRRRAAMRDISKHTMDRLSVEAPKQINKHFHHIANVRPAPNLPTVHLSDGHIPQSATIESCPPVRPSAGRHAAVCVNRYICIHTYTNRPGCRRGWWPGGRADSGRSAGAGRPDSDRSAGADRPARVAGRRRCSRPGPSRDGPLSLAGRNPGHYIPDRAV